MKISDRLKANHTIRPLTKKELQLGKQIFQTNINADDTDTVIIVTDDNMLQKEAAIWFETAKNLQLPVELFLLTGMTHSGQEPPDEIIAAAEQATISIFQTSYSLTHTEAGKRSRLNNGRGVSLPGADYELLMRTLSIDYTPVKNLGEQLLAVLQQQTKIHITSDSGTDLTAGIRQNGVINDSGFFPRGDKGNLPAGEVFFAPLPDTTNGKLVIDGSIADDVLDAPIVVTIKNGLAVKMDGGKAAKRLWEKLSKHGAAGRTVAEIGIGTNPVANITENLLEAEKAYGTVHVAFGNSSAIGGENNVPIHIDGLISNPTVRVSKKILVEDKIFRL
jgi:leucyl aminopeptidase (aminopeptidase T)